MVPVKRLTLKERLEVACYHSSQKELWQVDSDTGHVVCSLCGKPAPEVVLRLCAECGTEFVLLRSDVNWLPKYFVVADKVFEREFFCPPCY